VETHAILLLDKKYQTVHAGILPIFIFLVHITNSVKEIKIYLRYIIVCLTLSIVDHYVVAQDVVGLSFGYEYFPSAELVTQFKNLLGSKEFYGYRYNYQTLAIEKDESKLMIPSISYKIEF